MQEALVLVHGQKEDDQVRMRRLELLGGLNAVLVGHADVEQNHVGVKLLDEAQRLPSVGRLADDLDLRVGSEQGPQASSDDAVVVSDQDADGHTAPPQPPSFRPRVSFPP